MDLIIRFGLIMNFGQDSSFAGEKSSGSANATDANGIGDFYYTPPAGALAFCTKNLSDPSIALPGEHFNSILYTGDGGTTQAETGVGFQPDLVWGKAFVDNKPPWLFDSVRGVQKLLESSAGSIETTQTDMLNVFDADGFTHGNQSAIGGNGNNYIAWSWKAGGAPTATNSAGVGNVPTAGSVKINDANSGSALAGTIAATKLSANTTSGFSIVKFEGNGSSGATVAHGLSQAPELVIVKATDAAESWYTGSTVGTLDFTDYMRINSASGTADDLAKWNDTDPSASVVTFGNDGSTNGNGVNFLLYNFHSVDGYLKVGIYTGNGNVDGQFVYTGFEPKFLMCKRTSGSAGWPIMDRVRYPSNVVSNKLFINLNDGVVTAEPIVDFNSNGFKWRINDSSFNGSGDNYLFIAFAVNPFKTSNAA